MCGRFTLSQTGAAIAQAFHVQEVPNLEPQFNIAPTQMVTAVVYNPESNRRELQQVRWGLIPFWAKDKGIGAKLINARAETVRDKPAFRSAFKHRRCLVVADGFYEWRQQPKSKKQPFYFRLQNSQPFGFAGLWEQWESPEGENITSCTILTTGANELVQPVHERMPVILKEQDYTSWLDPEVQKFESLQQLLQPYPCEEMTAYPVSTLVNSPKYSGPECIQPQQMNGET